MNVRVHTFFKFQTFHHQPLLPWVNVLTFHAAKKVRTHGCSSAQKQVRDKPHSSAHRVRLGLPTMQHTLPWLSHVSFQRSLAPAHKSYLQVSTKQSAWSPMLDAPPADTAALPEAKPHGWILSVHLHSGREEWEGVLRSRRPSDLQQEHNAIQSDCFKSTVPSLPSLTCHQNLPKS
jgi:hypothetical protein